MPAEAVHLSALHDTAPALPRPWRQFLAAAPIWEAARIGALFVDLPYFESFTLAVVNYLLRRPQRASPWGQRFHTQLPIGLGLALAEAGLKQRRDPSSRDSGERLLGLALGYCSHMAVDRTLHPLVNRMAAERAARSGRTHAEEHHEVEKFQSILFHQQRLGADFMGSRRLGEHIGIDLTLLSRSNPISAAVQEVLTAIHGQAPGVARYRNWCRGYRQYVRLLSSPLGKTIAPERVKRRERPAMFDAVDFPARFAEAVVQSQRFVTVLCQYLDDGVCDDTARAAFYRQVPEGTIDPPGAAEDLPTAPRRAHADLPPTHDPSSAPR